MTAALIGLGTLAIVALALFGWAASRMGQPPVGDPASLRAAGDLPSERPVVVVLGDSITQGGLGADWVEALRRRLGDGVVVVNAGVGGQVTWDLRQRLDEVARCEPDAIVLLSGSNDAVGSLGGGWASFYAKGRPQAPSEAWFAEQYDALLGELTPLAPHLVALTLPPLGEDSTTEAAGIARRLGARIRETAARRSVDVLDIESDLLRLRGETGAGAGVPFLSGLAAFMGWTTTQTLRHRLLGHSWDRIAEGRGLVLSVDTIHPSDRAAAAMVDRVAPWVQRALLLSPQPTAGATHV